MHRGWSLQLSPARYDANSMKHAPFSRRAVLPPGQHRDECRSCCCHGTPPRSGVRRSQVCPMRAPLVTAVIWREMKLSPSQYRAVTFGALLAICAIIVTGAAVRAHRVGFGVRRLAGVQQHQVHRRLVTRTPRSSSSTACSPASSVLPSSPPSSARSSGSPRRRDLTLLSLGLVAGVARPDRARRHHGARRPPPGGRPGPHDPVVDPRRRRRRARPPGVRARRWAGRPAGVTGDQPSRRRDRRADRGWRSSPARSSPAPARMPATRRPAASAVDDRRMRRDCTAPPSCSPSPRWWRWPGASGGGRPSEPSSPTGSRRGSSSPCSRGRSVTSSTSARCRRCSSGSMCSAPRSVGDHCRDHAANAAGRRAVPVTSSAQVAARAVPVTP